MSDSEQFFGRMLLQGGSTKVFTSQNLLEILRILLFLLLTYVLSIFPSTLGCSLNLFFSPTYSTPYGCTPARKNACANKAGA